MLTDYKSLKSRHRAERASHHPNLALRVHRALSWLNRAEQFNDDLDGRFIFLWIVFNAAYATEIDEKYRLSEQQTFRTFITKLVEIDKEKRLGNLIWKEFAGSIRLLLDNQYVFQDFWECKNGRMTEKDWKHRFAKARQAANRALAARDTVAILCIVLSRIYVLRNQLIHGGATWGGSVNRDQLRDAVNLMSKLAPLVIEIMLDRPDTLWGDACYPVVA